MYLESYGKLMAPRLDLTQRPDLLHFLFQNLAGGATRISAAHQSWVNR